ncbi:MAG: NADH-quinone oxidoreductase subunit J [Deltaproteobacteria bacterium]|nr:NADH-quinone oxidoreductase subunit J [Deltaproteobacteria bacterium]
MAYGTLIEIFFYFFIIMILFGSWLAVTSQILMKAVMGLAMAMFGVAGLYLYLNSPFLALMQILIYVGAVCIMIVFGIMVGYTPKELAAYAIEPKNTLLSLAASLLTLGVIYLGLSKAQWQPSPGAGSGDFGITNLGLNLMNRYGLAFELISVVLLIAIIGAVAITWNGKRRGLSK